VGYYIAQDRLTMLTTHLSQNRYFVNKVLNPEPLVYEIQALTTWPRLSIERKQMYFHARTCLPWVTLKNKFIAVFAKLRKATICFVRLSVCQHGTTHLSLDGFLWNLIF